ncbi:MAG: hypothetical protein WC139_13175, partial [Candidatus Kapaibacterium sp.]
MKKINFLIWIFMCFTLIAHSQTIPFLNSNEFKWFNFECGGFVTAVYPAFNNSGLSNQILYAKTDVGGVYRSSNNGLSWNLISSYSEGTGEQNAHLFFSEYIIAGMAVHPTDPNQLIISWGNNKNDASHSDNYKCLWRTTNGGINWVKSQFINPPENYGPWFQGDVFERKLGGECILYDPRPGPSKRVFVGGISPNSDPPILFMSLDSGKTFSPVFQNFTSGDTITCIAMHKSRNEVYVGTTSGIYKSQGFNGDNPKPFYKLNIPIDIGGKNIRRMLLKNDGKLFFVFGTDTNFYVKGGGIARYDSTAQPPDSVWADLTGNFGTDNAYTGNYFSLLTWADTSGSVLLAGRVYNPVKKSINDGENWNGEGGFSQIKFKYNPVDFPEHQPLHEMNDFIYSGLNFILKNPYYNCWYMGGGAGVRIGTENSQPLDNDIFSNVTWKYSTNGQSMPVVYDIAFEPLPNNWNPDVFFPISDWTMAYKNNQISEFSKLKYDYRRTGGSTANTWISNVSRLLISTDSTRVTYAIGGDLYGANKNARMYRRYMVNDDSCNIRQIQNHQLFTEYPNRFITDGVIFDHGSYRNRILILVGSTEQDTFPNFNTGLGLYFSTNKGESFYYCYFGQQSQVPGINTLDQYHSSKLPSVGYNGTIGGIFDSQFNLATVPISSNVTFLYLYLPNGGMFISKNGGEGWSSVDNPVSTNLLKKGCLKYIGNSQLALAIEGGGLYKGSIDVNTGNIVWETFGGFTSASQVDVYNGKWVVFGQRDNINIDRLFKYTSWPTPDWRLITGRI